MTLIQIQAILALLLAFNVPTSTVMTVQGILQPQQATTTSLVATTTLEATPSGNATITVETPSQSTPAPAPQPVFSAPAPQPSCTLNAWKDNGTYYVSWTTQNTSSGKLYAAGDASDGGRLKTWVYDINPSILASSTQKNFGQTHFELVINGGSSNCSANIEPFSASGDYIDTKTPIKTGTVLGS